MSLNKPIIFETRRTRYIGIDLIGEGGAGRIYQAVDDVGNVYAIKLLHTDNPKGEKAKRFKNEVMFCFRNQHRNIITVIDHGVFTEGKRLSPFYVMPLYPSSLKALIATGIPREKVLFYFEQLLDGLEAAHRQQVIHRDLKPENVLYDERQDRLLIADFGIAHFKEEACYTNVLTSPNARLANFQYAAPEQRSRGMTVDHRADIYALGLIFNELFTKKVPHGTGYKTIRSVVPEYGYLDEVVASMLHQSAEERPASIAIVKQAIVKSQYKNGVCIVCELAEEAQAFIRAAQRYYHIQFTQGSGDSVSATMQDKEGTPFPIHVSWPQRNNPIELVLHLKPVFNELKPRFVVMTGVCTGNKSRVKRGDLVFAERTFSLDDGKFIKNKKGQIKQQRDLVTFLCTHKILQFARKFDSWRSDVVLLKEREFPYKYPVEPELHISPLASSYSVQSQRNNIFSEIQKFIRGTCAIDQLGCAFFQQMTAEYSTTHFLLVKGVSGYLNEGKDDMSYRYAAEASSMYVLSFIKEYMASED